MSNLQTFMERMCKHSDVAEKMTNAELAEHLIDDVWSQMEMDSPEACLVDEAIHRLKAVATEPRRG